jgi:dihydrofolate synthase/folylpolyglutamate synthase
LLHFAHNRVDVAVLEVGLGGRLDSTNVCHPLLSVITSISFDHTKQLGNSLAAIATEKAGIIKPQVPVVSGVANPEPRDVIRQLAAANQSPLVEIDRDFAFCYEATKYSDEFGFTNSARASFCSRIREPATWTHDLQIGMLGRHQAANAAVAIASLNQLEQQGFCIPDAALRLGLETARCPARVEVFAHEPTVIIDAAHNVASVEALIETLNQHFPSGPRLLVFATSRDKDAHGMLSRLLPHFEHVILTRFKGNPRFFEPAGLYKIAQDILELRENLDPPRATVVVCDEPQQAWQEACAMASSQALICVAGSTFIAGEIRPFVANLQVVGG